MSKLAWTCLNPGTSEFTLPLSAVGGGGQASFGQGSPNPKLAGLRWTDWTLDAVGNWIANGQNAGWMMPKKSENYSGGGIDSMPSPAGLRIGGPALSDRLSSLCAPGGLL
jgi:hypothetical protein